MEHYGERIKAAREGRGWTQEQLARKVGIGRSTLSTIESGGLDTTTTTFFDLAKALALNPSWLYTGKGQRDPIPLSESAYIASESVDDLAEKLLDRGPEEIGRLMALIVKKQSERKNSSQLS